MARAKTFDQSWVPAPGTVLDDRYRLDEMVDRGGMGVIMRGEHIRMKREVAVKLLSPDIATESGYRARFRREVDLAATIEHPNIVRCYDFGETSDGVLYLVMELLDGQSLKEILMFDQRVGTRRLVGLIVQLLDGMSTAHLQNIVHRDLKPSNVYVCRDHRGDEVVKVLDFGLAKSLTSDHLTLTKKGAVCGTASYVAPESLVLQQIGTAGDVYAVGLLMLEMLIGRQVCQSRAMAQTFLQHLVVPARIPRRIWDSPLGPILAKSLMKHPDDRYANAEEMFQAMRPLVATMPDILLEPSELPPLPPDNLDNALLMQLGNGKYATIDALRDLPAPEPWDIDANIPDDATTLRGVMFNLEEAVTAATPAAPPTGEGHTPRLPTQPSAEPEPTPEPPAAQSPVVPVAAAEPPIASPVTPVTNDSLAALEAEYAGRSPLMYAALALAVVTVLILLLT